MKKTLISVVLTSLLVPTLTFAQVGYGGSGVGGGGGNGPFVGLLNEGSLVLIPYIAHTSRDDELIALYQQLIKLLIQELQILQNQ